MNQELGSKLWVCNQKDTEIKRVWVCTKEKKNSN